MSSISKTRAVHFLFLCFFAESALKHSNLSPSQGKDFRTAPTLALLTWWQITKYVAWKQLEHVLCLAELIDSNTTIGIWRIWEGIRGLTGVYEKQSGARDSSCFQETKHPRQVHRKPCSPLLLSTQSLEGVVWISETQRKYSWLFPHIHVTTGPGDPATYTQQKWNHERRISNTNSAFSNTKVRIYHFSRSSGLKDQDPELCVDGKSVVSLVHGDGRLCLIVLTAHLLFHKQLYFICCSSSLRLSVTGYLPGQVFSCNLHIRSYLYYNPYMCLIVLSQ